MTSSRFLRSAPRALVAAALTALLVIGALGSGAAPATAADTSSPSGLTASDAPIPILSWERVAGATGYDVEVSRVADFTTTLAKASTLNRQYVPTVQMPTGELWWRVRAKAASGTSTWASGSFSRVAGAAPVPIRPLPDAAFTAPTAPQFTWQPVFGATSYTVQISRDPQFIDPALITERKQKSTAAYLTAYPATGDYYWRVSAELSTGYASAWSTSSRFRVNGLPPVQLTAPTNGFDGVREVVLDWEPVPGAASYQLQISTDGGFLSVTHSATGVVSTRYSPAQTLANDEYYWRVRAVDASGSAAPWPETPWRFRRAWPDQPTLLHPQGDAPADQPLFYEWTPVELASKYTLFLYDSTGKQVCTYTTVNTTVADECLPTKAGAYTWKVRGTDEGAGIVTDLLAQSAASFTYQAPSPVTPAAAGSLSVDDVHGHAATITGTAAIAPRSPSTACTSALPATCIDLRQVPVLSWDPVPGATGYKLTVARDRELTNIVSGYSGISLSGTMWAPSATLPDSQAGSAYFWVVQPCAGSSCAPIAYPEHSFAKKSVAPRLALPIEGQIVSDDVVLDWGSQIDALRHASAQTGSSLSTVGTIEAKSYTVQTSTDQSFGSTIDNATVDQTTFTSFVSTYPEGFVYWRVRSTDGSGNVTVWSEPSRFEKRSPVPSLVAPVDGQPLAQDLALTWTALPYAASYDIEVYSGPTKVDGAAAFKYTSWVPVNPFPVSATPYTWRVRRVDAKGRQGAWSETRSFSVVALPPALESPIADGQVAPGSALFSWLPDPRATSYRFERRKPGATDVVESVSTRATAWAPTTALPAGTAEWRVVALDAQGKLLGEAAWQRFAVVDTPVAVTPVSISGSGKTGTDLRLSAPTFDPVVETTTYQWYRGTSPIASATGEIYTVTSADLGKLITVRATGTLPGFKAGTSTSNAITGVSGDALVAISAPTIRGQPAVGQTLTVGLGSWSDNPRLTYQWFRNGKVVAGATRTTYAVTSADAGSKLLVVEIATVTGRDPGYSISAPVTVEKVRSSTAVALSAATATVKERVTSTATITAGGLSAPGGSVTFFDGKKKLGTVKLKTGTTAVLRLPRLKPGKHVIKAVYVGSSTSAASSGKAKVVVKKK